MYYSFNNQGVEIRFSAFIIFRRRGGGGGGGNTKGRNQIMGSEGMLRHASAPFPRAQIIFKPPFFLIFNFTLSQPSKISKLPAISGSPFYDFPELYFLPFRPSKSCSPYQWLRNKPPLLLPKKESRFSPKQPALPPLLLPPSRVITNRPNLPIEASVPFPPNLTDHR